MALCDHYMEWISARLDGQLTPAEERELEGHLDRCPRCRELAAELAQVSAALHHLEEVPAPEGFAQGVMDRIRAQEAPASKIVPLFRRPQVRALAGLAACAALCVGLYQAGLFPGPTSDSASGPSAETAFFQEDRDLWSRSGGGADGAVQNSAAAGGEAGAEALTRDVVSGQEPESLSPTLAESKAGALTPDASSPQEPLTPSAVSAGLQAVDTQDPGTEAVLTLSQLPQGAEEILGADAVWSADEAGRRVCVITGEQMDALTALAERQDLTCQATGSPGPEESCLLVLEVS